MWKPRHELIKLLAERLVTQAVESGEMVLKGSAPSLPAQGGSSSDSPLAPKPSTSPEGLTRQRSQTSLTGSLKDLGAGAFRAGASLKDMGVTGVGSATGVGTAALSKGVNFLSNFAQMHSSNGKDASPSFEVLSEMVTGYKCVPHAPPTSCSFLLPLAPSLRCLLPCVTSCGHGVSLAAGRTCWRATCEMRGGSSHRAPSLALQARIPHGATS